MTTKTKPRVAIIGATGMTGRELIRILEERSFPLEQLSLYASENSAGEKIEFNGDELVVNELKSANDIEADIAFFSTGSSISLLFAEKLAARNCLCIDKSSAFRLRDTVPLIVPEVNGLSLKQNSSKIIASPNCIVTPLVQVLAPLHALSPLTQVIVSTYQAVSGAGQDAFYELETQVRDLFNLRDPQTKIFDKRIAFNILPFIPTGMDVDALGKTDEEAKLIAETKKILKMPELNMEATCVRVPVFNGHSMAVQVACTSSIKIDDVKDILARSPGIILIDNPNKGSYPTPLDASGQDVTLVGRVRQNTAVEHGVSLWISSDNLRTGASLNAVRIAETIMLEQK